MGPPRIGGHGSAIHFRRGGIEGDPFLAVATGVGNDFIRSRPHADGRGIAAQQRDFRTGLEKAAHGIGGCVVRGRGAGLLADGLDIAEKSGRSQGDVGQAMPRVGNGVGVVGGVQ